MPAPASRRKPERRRRFVSLPHTPRPYDVEPLLLFVNDRGRIRPRSVTGLSVKQQRQVARAIKQARELALLPYVRPAGPAGPADRAERGRRER